MIAAFLLAFARILSAQTSEPDVSTQTAVAASTAAAQVVVSTAGVRTAGVALEARLKRAIHAVLHAEAKEWEPLSLKAGGDPAAAATKVVLRQEKVKGRYRGVPTKATATIRLHKTKDESWLVVSVWAQALERRRRHLEVRLRIVEGFVEDVRVAVVSVVDRRYSGAAMDSYELRTRAVAFAEASAEKGQVLISALDPRPSKSAANSGQITRVSFGDIEIGLADVSWAVVGLE